MLQTRKNNKQPFVVARKPVIFQKGSLLVELMVAIAIVVSTLGFLVGLGAFSAVASARAQHTAEAVALAEEMLEVLRNYRDGVPWMQDDINDEYDGFGVLAFPGPYYLEKSTDTPAKWKTVSGIETVGIFSRQVTFAQLRRDSTTDDIVSSGGYVDTESVEATVSVSWQEKGDTFQVTVIQYITNWQQL